MKKMKVYLQYPWKVLDSPYYKYLVRSPPRKIEYISYLESSGAMTNRKKFRIINSLKAGAKRALNTLGVVIPNAHLSPEGNYDLIHCAHCLSKNENKPWVADVESWWQLWVSGEESRRANKKIESFLLNKNCKKIMPWTNRTKEELLKKIPGIANKVEVVYPAVPIPKFKRYKNRKIKILFATRYFWIKGGLVALETLRRIQSKYDVEIVFISDAPENIKKEYKDIKIQDIVPHEKLIEHYKTADIFFYPSFLDTFGFSLLESLSYGVPILTVSAGGTRNGNVIVEYNKTGIVVDFPYYHGNSIYTKCLKLGDEERKLVDALVKKMSFLIDNEKIRERISKNCTEEIKKGKFSIERRNRKLRKIYEEAINGS
jgi:glycosyltransferase involved in cell wall biosynthesis